MEYFKAGTANLSLYAIPAYYALCFVPHVYSGSLLTAPKDIAKRATDGKMKPGKVFYNMPNPRSVDSAPLYAGILDKVTFSRWERARGAHNNLLESAPFVVSAILAGIFTKLPAEQMNLASAVYLGTRVAYIISYIRVEKGLASFQRTFWFFSGIFVLAWMWAMAGQKIATGYF